MKKILLKLRGFSLIELEVALVILAIGVFGLAGIFKVYSQQISYIEQNCEPNLFVANPVEAGVWKEYWIVSHHNNWIRQFVLADVQEKDPADSTSPAAWRPDVEPGQVGICDVTTTSAYSYNPDTRVVSVNINVVEN